ncbi:MAG: hypothetical protein LUC43_05935 [Burkholderiales bacterium]|nr:hypothetical protein [Burkholderiales bacterium]
MSNKEPLDVKSILLKYGKIEEQAYILIEDLAEQESYETMVLELNK